MLRFAPSPSTGGLGAGGACAASGILGLPASLYSESSFRPHARLAAGRLVAPFASACIDTSDALVTALDQLGRINDVGFELDVAPNDLCCHAARVVAAALAIDPVAFFAQPHGEFELAMTVPAERRSLLEDAAAAAGVELLCIGRVVRDTGIRFLAPTLRTIDGGRLRALYADLGDDAKTYLRALLQELARTSP